MGCKVKILYMVLFFVMFCNFTIFASAQNAEGESLYNFEQIELNDDVKNILKEAGFDEFTASEFSEISLDDVFRMIINVFSGSLKKPISMLTLYLAMIIICSFTYVFLNQNQSLSLFFESFVTLIIGFVALSDISYVIKNAVSSIYSAGILMKSLIPVTGILVAMSGSPSMAVSYNAVSMYCAQLISAVCRDFLTPIISLFASVSVCASVNQSFNSESLLNFIKRCVAVILGFIGTVFTGVIALKDVLAVGIDKVAVKGVKFLLGSSVPVVGSALSEGLSSIIASVALMKNTYGTIGIIVVVCTTLPAVCELLLWMTVLSASGYAAQVFGLSGISKTFLSLQYVMSMLLSVLLFVIYVLIVISAMVMLLGNK